MGIALFVDTLWKVVFETVVEELSDSITLDLKSSVSPKRHISRLLLE